MIIDGHHHIVDDFHPCLRGMNELGIRKTVIVGIGVRDLGVVTIRDSFVFKYHFLLRTLGVMKARILVHSDTFRKALLEKPRNDSVLRAIREEPDRFIGFAFLNPESADAVAEAERCLAAGMRGIKLALVQYPTDLSGPRMASLCEVAEHHNVPIYFHQGLTRESSDASSMVTSFKNVRFIIAHAGVQYFPDAIRLAASRENVFVDISSCIVTEAKIRILHRKLGAGKLLFGSDVPVMAVDPSEAMDKIANLRICGHDKERILGLNLQEILGLKTG